MNVKEYISSGVIESYVLGLATDAERQEFEAACLQYPEVVQARMQFEQALEAQLLKDAVAPPAGLKKKIEALVSEAAAGATAQPFSKPHAAAPVRTLRVWQALAAASVAALVGVLVWAISLNTKNTQLATQNRTLQQNVTQTTTQLTQLQTDAQRMQGPGVKLAAMQGTANAPGALATVYWDTTSTDVYMMINNLPQPASDKQYQLWALLDNKPIDLGVFDLKQQQLLVKMKNVQGAQAFAITLERKGGSPAPTMSALYVVGNL